MRREEAFQRLPTTLRAWLLAGVRKAPHWGPGCGFLICALATAIASPSASPLRFSSSSRLAILATVADGILPGDGTTVCSGHGAVLLCAEGTSKLTEEKEK